MAPTASPPATPPGSPARSLSGTPGKSPSQKRRCPHHLALQEFMMTTSLLVSQVRELRRRLHKRRDCPFCGCWFFSCFFFFVFFFFFFLKEKKRKRKSFSFFSLFFFLFLFSFSFFFFFFLFFSFLFLLCDPSRFFFFHRLHFSLCVFIWQEIDTKISLLLFFSEEPTK